MQRLSLTMELLQQATEAVIKRLGEILDEHGLNAYASPHEIMGLLEEEYELEFKQAVKANDPEQAADELLDIAAVAIKGLASMVAGAQYKAALEKRVEELKQNPSREDAAKAADNALSLIKKL